jgi:hypothetical protein
MVSKNLSMDQDQQDQFQEFHGIFQDMSNCIDEDLIAAPKLKKDIPLPTDFKPKITFSGHLLNPLQRCFKNGALPEICLSCCLHLKNGLDCYRSDTQEWDCDSIASDQSSNQSNQEQMEVLDSDDHILDCRYLSENKKTIMQALEFMYFEKQYALIITILKYFLRISWKDLFRLQLQEILNRSMKHLIIDESIRFVDCNH